MRDERPRSVRHAAILAGIFLIAALWGPAWAETPESVEAGAVLVLGPIEAPPAPEDPEAELAPAVETVPEIDPETLWPDRTARLDWGGPTLSWRESAAPGAGVPLERGVHWIAARLEVGRFSRVKIRLDGAEGAALYVNGHPLTSPESVVPRGSSTVMARVEIDRDEPAPVTLRASAAAGAGLRWHLEDRVAPARYRIFRKLQRFPALAISPDGALVAREALTHDGGDDGTSARRWLDVLSKEGEVVAPHLGGPGAAPLAFSPDGSRLALTLPGKPHGDLAIWNAATGRLRRLLAAEPGLQGVRWSPDGRGMLVISSKGAETAGEPGDAVPSRRVHPRDRVPDFVTGPHLHWVDSMTGARRRLTAPGDHVLDDAAFGPGGETVFYALTVPIDEHPWFETRIRQLDLRTGEDRRLDTFRAGWEIRPSQLAVSPDGASLAFVGPPGELGEDLPARNVLHSRLYRLNLETLERRPLPLDTRHAYGYLRAPVLAWTSDGQALVTTRLEGSSLRLVRVGRDGRNRWSAIPLADGSETIDRVALAPGAAAAAVVTSSRSRPRELWTLDLVRGEAHPLERPNAELAAGWRLAPPEAVPVTGPAGDRLDAWYYPPSFAVETRRIPLVVYYYGGAVPTPRSFVPMHQMLSANGYGVLVVNPRGAAGYSQEFADHHAGDWGPLASADILAAVDRLLEARAEINPAAIGVFGGSYGGFMTNYLLTRTDRFGAAVSMYGISDIATYWARGAWGWTYGDMASGGAVPWEDHDLYVERSPLRLAGRIRTPLLLMHGAEDENVPIAESEQLYTVLAVQGRPVELVTFPRERHGLSEEYHNRIAHRTMILEWFDRHLRGQPLAWEHRWNDADR